MTSDDTLILRLAHYDGAGGEIVRQWLADLHMSRISHGWRLMLLMGAISDNVARAERLLDGLRDHGFIGRLRKDLSYAPEIRFFGVGGTFDVEGSDSSLLFTYAPTARLSALIKHAQDRG